MRAIRLLPLLAAMAILLAACSAEETTPPLAELDASVSQGLVASPILGTSVAALSLPDVSQAGAPFAFEASDGNVLVVYFGFTACPDICPTTLSDLRSALGEMGDRAEDVEVAMVTIDPERDLDATVEAYLEAFIPGGHPLRTSNPDELDEVVAAFGATYDVIKTESDVEVFHTAYLYAVDDDGIVRIIWPFGAEPERISGDLTELLQSA